jgi:hypothetical protein
VEGFGMVVEDPQSRPWAAVHDAKAVIVQVFVEAGPPQVNFWARSHWELEGTPT